MKPFKFRNICSTTAVFVLLVLIQASCQGTGETTDQRNMDTRMSDQSFQDADIRSDVREKDMTPHDASQQDIGDDTVQPPDVIYTEPNLKILRWQGHKGAASLTFDDASRTHLDMAIPILDTFGVSGTFFIYCGAAVGREADWKIIAAAGVHELGNHSENHNRPDDLPDDGEIDGCDQYIRETLGAEVNTFAYPYGVVGDPYRSYSDQNYIAARSTKGGVVEIDVEPNWPEIPTRVLGVDSGQQPLRYLETAEREGHWANFLYHTIDNGGGALTTTPVDLEATVQKAVSLDLWVDTFARVATYLRISQAIEIPNATISLTGEYTWTWEVPKGAESTVKLHIIIDGGVLLQNDTRIRMNSNLNVYEVDPRAGHLVWKSY